MGLRNAATKNGHRTQAQNSHFAKPPRFTYDSRAQAQRVMCTGGAALLKVAIAMLAHMCVDACVRAAASPQV